MISEAETERVILNCMDQLNQQRKPEERLSLSPDAQIFGEGSPLDSMGLVTLMMDIEDSLADHGAEVSLSDASAMSQRRSPYRDVPTLKAFIVARLSQTSG